MNEPDIELKASVKSRKLTFGKVPDIDIRTDGRWQKRTERDGLPDQVEPGKTYRNTWVSWEVKGAFADGDAGES